MFVLNKCDRLENEAEIDEVRVRRGQRRAASRATEPAVMPVSAVPRSRRSETATPTRSPKPASWSWRTTSCRSWAGGVPEAAAVAEARACA